MPHHVQKSSNIDNHLRSTFFLPARWGVAGTAGWVLLLLRQKPICAGLSSVYDQNMAHIRKWVAHAGYEAGTGCVARGSRQAWCVARGMRWVEGHVALIHRKE